MNTIPTSRVLTLRDNINGDSEVHYLTDYKIALDALLELAREPILGYDTETYARPEFKSNPKAGLYMCQNLPRLVQLGTPKRIYVFDVMYMPEIQPWIGEVLSKQSVKVAHNAIFDVKIARKHFGVTRFGKVCCTELMSRQVKCGLQTYRVSLAKAALEHLGETVEKEEQRSDWSAPILTDSQLLYAARDVVLTLRLRERLLVKVKELGIGQAVRIDFDTIDPVASMELAGLPIDSPRWIQTDTEMLEKKWDVVEKLHDIIRGTLEPQQALFSAAPIATKRKDRRTVNSTKDMIAYLEALDVEVPEKTDRKTGRTAKTTKKDALETIQDSHEMVPLLMSLRELAKRNDSYGSDYIDEYVCGVCKRIHAQYDPQGTKTARFNCGRPNLQQIPGIPEYRECFRPSGAPLFADSVFVIADYSQIELRMAAHLTGDPGYITAFNAGEDFHSATAKMLVNNPDDAAAVKQMRTAAKRINFGIIYGLGKWRLAAQLGIAADRDHAAKLWNEDKLKGVVCRTEWRANKENRGCPEPWENVTTAEDYMNKYVARFDVLMQGLNTFGRDTAKNREIRTWVGRLVKFIVDPTDKGSVSQAERNGKNTPIQGGAGEILKIAIRRLFDAIHESGRQVQMVHIVHDEIILEAAREDSQWALETMSRIMREAGELIITKVPVAVTAEIAESWADKV